jgi:divalent metal cation (Fe/Co/Zn/Cd) transporter
VHDFSFKRVSDRVYLACHVTMADDLPLSRVHDLQTELETRFKQAAPQVFRVLIHPEPSTDNRR